MDGAVQVWNSCGFVQSNSVTVTINTCTAPSISVHPQSATMASGSTRRLTVAASGTTLHYQWYQGTSGMTSNPVGTDQSFYDASPTTTTSYWVRVSNSCG